MLQLCGGSFRIEMPRPFSDLIHLFDFLTFNIFDFSIVPLECFVVFDWTSKFAVCCAVPLVLLVLFHPGRRRIHHCATGAGGSR